MAQGSFSATVSQWVRETKERRDAVHRESAQRVFAVAQTPVGAGGAMPVDTGFLRASLVITLGLNVPATQDKPDGTGAFSPPDFALTIAQADIASPITGYWTASYSRHVEYGSNGRAGRRFVSLAAQRWPAIVSEVCAEAQSRAT